MEPQKTPAALARRMPIKGRESIVRPQENRKARAEVNNGVKRCQGARTKRECSNFLKTVKAKERKGLDGLGGWT